MLASIFLWVSVWRHHHHGFADVPGEASSAITMLDGHAMAKQGRAGVALSIAGLGSFFGGTVATIGLVLFAPPLASVAVKLGPPEYFSLVVMVCVLGWVSPASHFSNR